jgi:hypothetical protein
MTVISSCGFYQGFLARDFPLCFTLLKILHLLNYFADVLSINRAFC